MSRTTSPLPFTGSRSGHGSTPSRFLFKTTSAAAVREKLALSSHRQTSLHASSSAASASSSRRERIRVLIRSFFVLLPFRLGGRSFRLPVLKIYHPREASSLRREANGTLTRTGGGVFFPLLATILTFLLGFVGVWILLVGRRLPPKPGFIHGFGPASTLILSEAEIERIWAWEIASGRHPSTHPVPRLHSILSTTDNPSLPPLPHSNAPHSHSIQEVNSIGPSRIYQPVDANHGITTYTTRPQKGVTLDLDKVMSHCDFSRDKYVRDCLEVLRVNARMDEGIRRRDLHGWELSYLVAGSGRTAPDEVEGLPAVGKLPTVATLLKMETDEFRIHLKERLKQTIAEASSPSPPSDFDTDPACDSLNPRIFHMFWAGNFTDKPYIAALSFLYTQPLFLSSPINSPLPPSACRPQLWIWINPGPATSHQDETTRTKMRAELASNPWSAPFLHKRFEGVIRFKMWNTTDQLDAIEEMEGWRDMVLFNSGGVKYGNRDDAENDKPDRSGRQAALKTRLGSTSRKAYDRLSVVLSDMARFILTHRYGGIYLDADTIFLRDWEELWNWKGGFAYRWSRLEKYNTAVLKMSKGSAVGHAIFRSAVKNGLDFHPMTVSRYLIDAKINPLLFRLPDALFDPSWLNTEYYQRDRPPFPYFKKFDEFFQTPSDMSSAPSMLGFDGFFKGAFSHHFHNFWWLPVDPSQDYPDLGSRFHTIYHKPLKIGDADLSWSAVLKRTFEQFLRGERPNMYGEVISWDEVEEENEIFNKE